MKVLKELSRTEFKSKFGEEEQCLSFLASTKWSEGYNCLKCHKGKFSKWKTQRIMSNCCGLCINFS